MIEFHPVSLADRGWIEARLREAGRIGCEYSFGNIFTYGAKMELGAADVCGCLVTRCSVPKGDEYCYPIGAGNTAEALRLLVQTAEQSGRPAWAYGMNEEDKALIERCFGERFQIALERDTFDYVYRTEDLTALAGKKYQSKRNHISFFKRNTRWQYEPITPASVPECLQMSEQWLERADGETRDELEQELQIIRRAFEYYEELGYVGGLLRADGRVIAYTMGEELTSEVFCVHVEKAFAEIRGAYAMINQQFAQHALQGYRFINREDDVGAENLRRAKLSYHPAFLLEKYETRLV